MDTCLAYLKGGNLKEKANVIEKTWYNPSDKVADLLNTILECKKNEKNIISSQEAAALQVYLNLSKATYQALKNFTDSKGVHFLPTWNKTRDEREKCIGKKI